MKLLIFIILGVFFNLFNSCNPQNSSNKGNEVYTSLLDNYSISFPKGIIDINDNSIPSNVSGVAAFKIYISNNNKIEKWELNVFILINNQSRDTIYNYIDLDCKNYDKLYNYKPCFETFLNSLVITKLDTSIHEMNSPLLISVKVKNGFNQNKKSLLN